MTTQIISEFETALTIDGNGVSIVNHIEDDRMGTALVTLTPAQARQIALAILAGTTSTEDEWTDDIAFGMEAATNDALDRW